MVEVEKVGKKTWKKKERISERMVCLSLRTAVTLDIDIDIVSYCISNTFDQRWR